jgi:hypothetical protein
MKYVLPAFCLLLGFSSPAFSNVTVSLPASGAAVSSPFALSATASPCSGQSIASMGYSLDNSTSTTIVYSTAVSAEVAAGPGAHVLHVKSWGAQGAVCVTSVSVTVVAAAETSIPSTAILVSGIQKQTYRWQGTSDAGTGGLTSGTMSMVTSPTLSGYTRKFSFSFSGSGGERYWASFGADTGAHNFLYDVEVYLDSTASDIANIEMDMNQVIPNGQTMLYGFQCDGYTETWDYTTNAGSPEDPIDEWRHSSVPCNPRTWTKNTWHHIQVAYSRDDDGNATYKYVVFDGVQKNINETVPSAFALGWGATLLTNFQIDGLGGYGSANVYVDKMNVYRW